MTDLFKKLNVLVRSTVNDVLGDDLSVGGPRRRPLNPSKLGKDIDKEIAALRQRINEALDYEDVLAGKVDTLQREMQEYDTAADDAVQRGDDYTAKQAVTDLKRTEQRLAMAESDLHSHRLVAQELITRVNELDAAVSDARRAEAQETETASQPETPTPAKAVENDAADAIDVDFSPVQQMENAQRALADALREARQKMTTTTDDPLSNPPAAESKPEVDDAVVDDDLTARRNRLSKK